MSVDTPVRRSANTNRSMTEFIKQKEGRAVAIFYNSAELADPDGKQINRPRRFANSSARTFLQVGRTTQISLTAQTELAATNPQFAIVRNPKIYPISSSSSSIPMDPFFDSLNIANSSSTNDIFIVKYNSSGKLNWARRIGGAGPDTGKAIVSDINGNVYVTGYFSSSLLNIYNSDNTTIFKTLTLAGGADPLLIKYDSKGNPQWATQMPASGSDVSFSVAADQNGNVYICGYFEGNTFSVDNADGTIFGSITKVGNYDVFIIKYNTNGFCQWVRKIGGTGADAPLGISTDLNGNVYVSGVYSVNSVNIYTNDTTIFTTLSNSGANDSFIVKYNTNGSPQWARKISGPSDEFPSGISVDSNGNVFVTGWYYSTTTIIMYDTDNNTSFASLSASVSNDAFIAKYDTNGTPKWIIKIGGSGNEYGISVFTDNLSNVYIVGYYDSALNVYNSDNTTIFSSLTNTGSNDCFIIKYNTDGNPQWVRKIGGTGDDKANSVSVDINGNVYVAGQYSSNPVTIFNTNNTSSFATLSRAGATEGFIVKYSTSGVPQWALRISGASDDFGTGIFVDTSTNIYVVGYFNSLALTFTSV